MSTDVKRTYDKEVQYTTESYTGFLFSTLYKRNVRDGISCLGEAHQSHPLGCSTED